LADGNFYYIFEYISNRIFSEFTGIRFEIEDLKDVKLVQLEQKNEKYLEQIARGLKEEFDINTEINDEIIPIPQKAIEWGTHIFTPFIAQRLSDLYRCAFSTSERPPGTRPKKDAVLAVTRYELSILPPISFFRLIYRFTGMLGVTHPPLCVAFVTTINDRLTPKKVAETAIHEVAHLLGRHGYDPKTHAYGYGLLR
jgi:hypothetical protein